ncbi:MAG: NAD(P)H:quinone oxidoreductase [Rectinemataceae bacterium]
MKMAIVFYSLYGHMYRMAQAAEEGAKSSGAEVRLLRIPETLSPEILAAMHAVDAQKAFAGVPHVKPEDLEWADGIIFAVPTRFGNMPSQVAAFFDSTGQVWQRGGLVGKVGSVMSSSATQHGGAVTTIQHMHSTLLAHGMVVSGLPYAKCPALFEIDAVNGGSVFGATTISGGDGSRMPSKHELEAAKAQGAWAAELAGRLAKK